MAQRSATFSELIDGPDSAMPVRFKKAARLQSGAGHAVAKVEDAFTKSEKFAARHRGVSASANAVRLRNDRNGQRLGPLGRHRAAVDFQ